MTQNFNGNAVRPAIRGDARRIWEIRNEPLVRSASGSADPIPVDSHHVWFERTYFGHSAPNRCFVLEVNNRVEGYCRIDWDPLAEAYVVSIALTTAHQRHGFGHALLSQTLNLFLKTEDSDPTVIARIKANNARSVALFAKNGFAACGDSCYRLQQLPGNTSIGRGAGQ
jgi:L-amino acid N-acyltransferase YncA